MKNLKISAVLIICLTFICASCSKKIVSDVEGGACDYSKVEGFAKIISIKPAPEDAYNCPDNPRQVVFEFTPANLSDRDKYRFKNFADSAVELKINDGVNPSLSWIKKNKIETGKKYRCIRTELVKGTCTPVGFKFPELNLFPDSGCN